MTLEIELDSGDRAEARTFEGDILTFVSPRAFARGAPIRFAAVIGDNHRVFEGRCIRSKRVEGQRFEVSMRFVNLRREDRLGLGEALACTYSSTSSST